MRRRAARNSNPIVLPATPDRRRRLSEGALVEAAVRARLLGIPLLKLEATIVLAPADVTASSSALHDPPARGSTRVSGAAGQSLAEAVRSINESAELLAEVRRNGS